MATCIPCHGNGMDKPADPKFPIIASQHYDYLLQALTDYRKGTRSSDSAQIMRGIVNAMPPADDFLAAQFFANLKAFR